MLGLVISGETSFKTVLIYSGLSLLFIARLRFQNHMNMTIFFFIGIYLSQNFLVNSLDYVLFRRHRDDLGYYHDEDFLRSFSYKSHQAFMCLLFAVLFGQSFSPSHSVITAAPKEILGALFYFSIPVGSSMLMCFLFELTAETPDVRASLYKTELAKVFFTILHFYLLSMIFSNWL
jgi:hypothetical protein